MNSQYLVLENLLCHGVCPFYNWNVHVDDLELVWPENRMINIQISLLTFLLEEEGPEYQGTRTSFGSPCIVSHWGQTPTSSS